MVLAHSDEQCSGTVFEHSGVEAWVGVGVAFVFMCCAGGLHIRRSMEWQHMRG